MKNLLKRCGELSQQPFTLVAVEQDDEPLIYVNQAFRDLVLYENDEILGKNCRFLQGPLTNKEAVKRIHIAIQTREPVCEDILNYRKDGSTFWNRLVLLPIKVENEFYYFGMQHDVTEKKKTDREPSAQKVHPNDIADWIRNRLVSVILHLDMLEKKPSEYLLEKIAEALNRISEYVLSLP